MQSYADFLKTLEVGHVGWRLKEKRKISLGVVGKKKVLRETVAGLADIYDINDSGK